jgi:hypothetical protein
MQHEIKKGDMFFIVIKELVIIIRTLIVR